MLWAPEVVLKSGAGSGTRSGCIAGCSRSLELRNYSLLPLAHCYLCLRPLQLNSFDSLELRLELAPKLALKLKLLRLHSGPLRKRQRKSASLGASGNLRTGKCRPDLPL